MRTKKDDRKAPGRSGRARPARRLPLSGPSAGLMRFIALAGLAALLVLRLAVPAVAQSTVEQRLTDLMQGAYESIVHLIRSNLRQGTPEWDDAVRRSVQAVLSARPADCDDDDLVTDLCGLRPEAVPSEAMSPTIRVGDVILVVPPTAARPLRRGDVIFFRAESKPGHESERPVRHGFRLLGMPGDSIRLHDGIVEINGVPLRVEDTGETMPDSAWGSKTPILRETLPEGRSYRVARGSDSDPPMFDNSALMAVPADSYYVLGDNRHNATDSRFPDQMGSTFVRSDHVEGWAAVIYASPDVTRIGMAIQ